MKYILLNILLLTVFTSATNTPDKINCRIGCEPILFINNRLVIEVDVDEKRSAFIVSSAQTSQVKNLAKRTSLSLENELISGKVEFYSVSDESNSFYCPNKLQLPLMGIYGKDLLASCAPVVSIDFDKLLLCNLAEDKTKDIIAALGFQEVDARFSDGEIKIAVTINWKVYWFTIDTAYDGSFIMTFKENLPFIKERHTVWEKIGITQGNDRLYYNKGIWLNGTGYNSSITTVGTNTKAKVGVAFLKGFNWIFDHASKKVYYKKNGLGLNSFEENREHQISIINQKLVITARSSKNITYAVGSNILAVDGATVTSENICDIKDRLITAVNWRQIAVLVAE